MGSTRRSFIKNLPVFGTLPFIDLKTLTEIKSDHPVTENDEQKYGNVIHAPEQPEKWEAFRNELHDWRLKTRKQLAYTGESYEDPQFQWSQSNYTCCFLMMYDLEFYDPEKNTYSVDRVIDRGISDFGGYDSVVLWHAYPRIGVDDRNQFDFYRDMPGSLEGVREVVKEFQDKGIKVFINYNPWDTGTRREEKSDIDALVDMITAIDADGIFLDTLKEGGNDFREKVDKARPGVVLEGELAAELEILPTHHQSWAQWFGDRYVPGVIRDKWYERRHIQHIIARWNRDRTTELQQAWMNGCGIMIWENVFGQWIAWNDRDKSLLRTILPIQRRYSNIFNGEGWTPLVPTRVPGVFASLWEEKGIRIWTLINRHDKTVEGELLDVTSRNKNDLFFDLIKGKEISASRKNNSIALRGEIGPRSIGCFVSSDKSKLGQDFDSFLLAMREIRKGYSQTTGFPEMEPVIKPLKRTQPQPNYRLDNNVEIYPVTIEQRNEMRGRENGTYYSYPPGRSGWPGPEKIVFNRVVHIPHIAMDLTPVTNEQYYQFIKATGYSPTIKTNFLKHWNNGRYLNGKGNHPVVYVDLSDARAYAEWQGKRLPSEEEWLFAAQGYDKLRYPWGAELRDNCYNKSNDTTAVDAHPAGKSPFGCLDMCGNTWELTESEYSDRHNRFCVIKGGSHFRAEGSHWYVEGGPQPSAVSTKLQLLYPGIDRCATIGFRCVKDLF